MNVQIRAAAYGSKEGGWRTWRAPEVFERVVEYPYALSWLKEARGRRVLDVGCGPYCVLSQMLMCINYDVTVTDFSPSTGVVTQDDICKSKLPGAAYDAVFCVSALPHVYDKDAALGHIARVAKPGAVIVITCGYSHDHRTKTGSGYVRQSVEAATPGCRTICAEDVQRWSTLFDSMIDLTYWRAWEDGWYVGRRLVFPVRCDAVEGQLIGMVLRR